MRTRRVTGSFRRDGSLEIESGALAVRSGYPALNGVPPL